MKRVKVFRNHEKHELSLREIISEAGFKGISEEEMAVRLQGNLCMCGNSNGEFDLLPPDAPECIDGGKRYMVCRKCGCYSHL